MDFIRTYRHRFGVEPICDTLTAHGIAIAPSTFYAHQSRGFGPPEPNSTKRTPPTASTGYGRAIAESTDGENSGRPPSETVFVSGVTRSNG